MIKRESETLSFNEDGFDLEAHKKAAGKQASLINLARRARRKISVYKVLIMLLAFLIAYLLYNMSSDVIQRYDYNKYHTSEFLNVE